MRSNVYISCGVRTAAGDCKGKACNQLVIKDRTNILHILKTKHFVLGVTEALEVSGTHLASLIILPVHVVLVLSMH